MEIMKSRTTELLGTRYPIVQGGMTWVGRAELTAAVSNAGALRAEIARCRALTDLPFGVNLTIFSSAAPPPYLAYAQAIADNGVRIVETAGHRPPEVTQLFLQHGCTIIHKCTSARPALSAQARGVHADGIDGFGFECADHPGEDDVPGLILIPAAVRRLQVPVIASGGIADDAGMAAALALGADGVNTGTRFLLTQESPIHAKIKETLVGAGERDTALILRSVRNTARVYRSGVAQQVMEAGQRPGAVCFEQIRPLVAGARGRAGLDSGDADHGRLWAGQCIIPACAELIQRMVRECRQHLTRARSLCLAA